MKLVNIIFCLILLSLLTLNGQNKPQLKFNANSRFKIVQFTDLHLQYDSYRSDSVLVMMKKVIEQEKPDLVMLTGDVVGSDNRKRAWLKVAQVLIDAKTPWAAMFGNHDAEYELNKEQTMNVIVGLPYNLTERGSQDVAGLGNYVIPIQSSSSSKTVALCYVLDVSETNDPSENQTGVYSWIDDSQVNWYKKQSSMYAAQNGGKPLPALAFFHIPFPEYNEVVGQHNTYGHQFEVERNAPAVRSNLYTAMLESKDVMGTFVGHHHNNNFIGYLNNICLAFGQTSGRQSYGEIGVGARVIVLHEGERKFDSWILKLYKSSRDLDIWTPTQNNEQMFFVTYPDSFTPSKEKKGKINMSVRNRKNIAFSLSGNGKATIDWGDGSAKEVVILRSDEYVTIKHCYSESSTHTISINGDKITAIDCKDSNLSYLDVSNNKELTWLDCSNNQLINLDVRNTDLKVLWCNNNQLTGLNIDKNAHLTELYCHSNYLKKLNLTNNKALVRLNCSQNQLINLDLSENKELNRFDCYENRIKSLDFSHNHVLNYAVCSDNQFEVDEMNAMFNTLYEGAASKIFIGGNPGEEACDRTIALKRGWKVSLRY